MEFFATCPLGFEQLLADELRSLEVSRVRPLRGQVSFEGPVRDALSVCLWSRLASRVVAVLARVDATDSDTLYDGVSSIAWEEQLARGASFVIDAHGTNDQLRNTQFVALRTKDGVVDRLLARTGVRPSSDTARGDLRIIVRIAHSRALIGIDLAGEPLFRRGYEATRASQSAMAPLRPDYAAALLRAGGWAAAADVENRTLVVPFSGAGTIAVESAATCLDHAPGLLRQRWGFMGWAMHDASAWDELLAEAHGRAEAHADARPDLRLCDLRPGAQAAARQALRAAGLDVEPSFVPAHEELVDLKGQTLLAADLSWADRDSVALKAGAMALLSGMQASLHEGATAVALTLDEVPDAILGTPDETFQTIVGRDDATLRRYGHPTAKAAATVTLSQGERIGVLVPTSDQFAARLAKAYKLRRAWARREDVSCYRVYDTDLPDYAVSIDLFEAAEGTGRWLQVYEYAPPRSVDPSLAQARLLDVMAIAPRVIGVRPEDTFVRVRTRSRGGSQYADEARQGAGATRGGNRKRRGRAQGPELPPGAHLIDEGGLTFEVNFQTRLDCGIFLDHRDTRAMLREMAKQTKGSKRFLNLFAYTGTATCYAADGGMRHTTTVDLSRPSLEWAQRNMERNGFDGPEHEYVQADVIRWIGEQRRTPHRWDLVFCDVPTFSNSRRMGKGSFDVQRDHAELLIGISRLLTREGTCVFSCNLRTFKLDEQALAKAGVTARDITAETIPEDFSRNQRIHRCNLVQRAPRPKDDARPEGARRGGRRPGSGRS